MAFFPLFCFVASGGVFFSKKNIKQKILLKKKSVYQNIENQKQYVLFRFSFETAPLLPPPHKKKFASFGADFMDLFIFPCTCSALKKSQKKSKKKQSFFFQSLTEFNLPPFGGGRGGEKGDMCEYYQYIGLREKEGSAQLCILIWPLDFEELYLCYV